MTTLAERITLETGKDIRDSADAYELSGMFNRYRPDGAGLERLLSAAGLEGEILARLRRVFEATASDWKPEDWYFVIRRYPSISSETALQLAHGYLEGIRRIAGFRGETALVEKLSALDFEHREGARPDDESDTSIAIYECVTDLQTDALHSDKNEIFLLDEALYSMANDYFLVGYVLWPAMELAGAPAGAMDPYFDLWRCGVHVTFTPDNRALVWTST